jgi:hypothetical protein
MNYGYGGYNQPYMEQEVITVNTYQTGRPYYQQPMIVQPQPQVIIVEDRYAQNNMAST